MQNNTINRFNIKYLLFLLVMFFIGFSNLNAEVLDISNINVIDKSDNVLASKIILSEQNNHVIFSITLMNNSNNKIAIKDFKANRKINNIKIEYEYNKKYINSGGAMILH